MADPTSSPSFFLDEAVYDYVISHTTPVDDVQHSLMDATAKLGPVANMQIAPDMGMFLSMLVSAIRPSFAVEVGTFTGYSSLAIARALPEGGRLLCCDVSEEWTAMARRHWSMAGVDDRIDLVIAPAVDTLRALESGLESYPGCAAIISHDRWFLDRVATHVLAFEGDSQVRWFEGNFSEYEAVRKKELGADAQPHRVRYKPLVRG